MNIPFFSFEFTTKSIKQEVLKTFEAFYDSNWYVLGKFTTDFEESYAQFNQVRHCVGVSNGLDALHLCLRALEVGPGDEVIVPSNTYIATVLAVSYTGATPVFVEPRWETGNINPEQIERAITSKTRCIMPVHLYGQACEMEAIMKVAKAHNLYVVEDNAQAHGAMYNGKLTGSFGHVNATSFYPTKNVGALGEAGAITTNDQELANSVRMLRNYGSKERYYNEVIGYNNRIDEFEAAYLSIVLRHLQSLNRLRGEIAARYRDGLNDISGLELMHTASGSTHVNHLFVIKTSRRSGLQTHLSTQGIGTQIHYPVPPHLQKAYQPLGFKRGDFPVAEKLADYSLSLPVWPGLTPEKVDLVVDQIRRFYEQT